MPPTSAFHRSAVRVAVRGALSVSAVLGLGLAVAAVPIPAAASATVTTSAPASAHVNPADPKNPDFDSGALRLTTTTDTLPEDQATHFQAIAGDPVNRVYYLHNRGLLPLTDVTVSDPGNNGAAIHCGPTGTATIPTLLPLAWVTCTSTFTATPGEQHTTATASGVIFLLGVTLTDTDQTGYTAVVPGLNAGLSLNGGQPATHLPVGTPVSAVVTMFNSGSVALQDIGPLPPRPPLSIIGCSGGDGHGATVGMLNPGQSAFCTGALIPQPGTHETSVTVAGNWRWDHPITAQGPQGPEVLTIQSVASAQYTGIAVPTPPPPPPSTPPPPTPPPPHPGPPPTPAPPGSTPALVILQSPLPSPSPSPASTLPHHPTPAPTSPQVDAALQQAVSQFKAQRQLPLPLKVLVIIIIPAVAAAAGARRIASRRR